MEAATTVSAESKNASVTAVTALLEAHEAIHPAHRQGPVLVVSELGSGGPRFAFPGHSFAIQGLSFARWVGGRRSRRRRRRVTQDEVGACCDHFLAVQAAASPSMADASPSLAVASPSLAAASPSRAAASPSLANASPRRPAAAAAGGPPTHELRHLNDTDLLCAMCA